MVTAIHVFNFIAAKNSCDIGIGLINESIVERDVAWMDIHERKSSRPPEHFGDVHGIGPVIVKELAQMFVVFLHHMLFKLRNLMRQLGSGEVEQKWPHYNADFEDS